MWASVADATKDAACQSGGTPEPVKNVTAPGDVCTADSECFGVTGEATCSSGACATSRAATGECPSSEGVDPHKWCPVGNYCASGTCAPTKKVDEECSATDLCGAGLGCIALEKDGAMEAAKCAKFNALADGSTFTYATLRTAADPWLGYLNMCKSNHVIVIDEASTKVQCRAGDKSEATTEDALKTADGSGVDCKYTTYNDPTDPTKAVDATDKSKCGFNTGTAGYCTKRKGDSWFTDINSKVQAIDFTQFKCHVSTGVTTCYDVKNNVLDKNKDTVLDYSKALLFTNENLGWGLYADNDKCVKKAITLAYWGQTDAGMNISLASFGVIAMAISALFYMF